ncbi:MAG: methionine--tRNA ligase [Acetobacteraceae bacterium]|nr:methionine--tRNA ligase [Acetobacteraceae bacterium]
MTKRCYITTPIYYVNGAPHIGHAYTSIATDVMARFKRLDGYDVLFVTGTDEHGQKVEKAARDAGMDTHAFTDKVSADFRAMADAMGISYDDHIRTTEDRHKRSCAELWKRIAASGNIHLGHYEGWYAVRDEAFYDAGELTTRPDGTKVAPSGAPVEWVREPSYFFKLSEWQDKLLKFYEDNPDFIAPTSRRNEVLSFVRGGLLDLSISRTTFDWGIQVPGAPGHVMYVWLDALTNYITAAGFPDETTETWQKFWPADVHFVGKDIIRFHAVYWPAFLMAAGIALPKRISSHGWWVVDGEKMSKSVGNVIAPRTLAETYGLDQIRFFLLREKPFGTDGSMSHSAIVNRINTELANDLGNLAQRTLSLIARNCASMLPAFGAETDADRDLLAAANALPNQLRAAIDRQDFHEALEDVWKVIRACNAYIDHQAPWALRKTDIARMGVVLYVLVGALRVIATVLQPFMPSSMAKMLDQLGVAADARNLAALATPLAEGTVLPPPQGVFPRYVEPAL